MNDPKTYNLLVIGGGPAGIAAAVGASTFGNSVALVDKQEDIGGAGINTGTVPSKTLRETALALSGLRSRNLYGVDLSLRREVTVADFLGHEEHVKEAFHTSIGERLKTLNAGAREGRGKSWRARLVHVNEHFHRRSCEIACSPKIAQKQPRKLSGLLLSLSGRAISLQIAVCCV